MQRQSKNTYLHSYTPKLRRVALFAALLKLLFVLVLCDCETKASCVACDPIVITHSPETPFEAPEVCICPAAGTECSLTQTGEIVFPIDWDSLLSLPIVLPDAPSFTLGIVDVPAPAYRPPPSASVVLALPSLRAPPIA